MVLISVHFLFDRCSVVNFLDLDCHDYYLQLECQCYSGNQMCYSGNHCQMVKEASVFGFVCTVQLSLNFTHACGYMRARTHFAHVKFMIWSVSPLLHAVLSCALVRLNTRPHVAHHTNSSPRVRVYHQIHVVHQTCTTRISST